MALALLRLIGEEVRKERTTRVVAQLPVDVATFLINEKREWLHQLESQRETEIVLVPDPNMQTPNYLIRRVRDDEMGLAGNALTSYQMAGQATIELDFKSQAEKQPPSAPAAVQQIAPAAPAPTPVAAPVLEPSGPGLWTRLLRFLRGADRPAQTRAEPESGSPRREERHGGRPSRDHRDEHGGHRQQRGERGPRRDRNRNRNRDKDHDRDRDQHRDQDRNRPDDRARADQSRDGGGRHRERPAEAPPRPQPVASQGPEQQPPQQQGDGDSQRRRRRRRGRGGRGGRAGRPDSQISADLQHEPQGNGGPRPPYEAAQDSMPPSVTPAQEFAPQVAPPRQEPAAPMAPSAPPTAAPVEAPASPAAKSGQSYTVWSSTPGEGQHFGPKE